MTPTLIKDWKLRAKEKLAAATEQDENAISEAFAQQAYTAIGNRCRLIMKDPHLLGFEVVEKNEKNNRLVGVFAFRVADEILLAPVFYLNGQVKGQILMYRKGVNRFIPNNEKWISYLLSRGDDSPGRSLQSRQGQDATMDLNMYQLAGPPKQASANGWDIGRMWKEAKASWAITPPEHLFGDLLASHPKLKSAAAELVKRHHPFAEMLVLGKCLEQPVTAKQASAEEPGGVKLHLVPAAGMAEKDVELFYKRGYALEDNRKPTQKADVVWTDEVFATVHTANRAGIQTVITDDNKRVKVLYAPLCSGGDTSIDSSSILLFLEGPDKGRSITYRDRDPGKLPVFAEDRQVETKGRNIQLDVSDETGDKIPSKGKSYLVWFPSKQKAMRRTVFVRSVDKSGNVIRVNMADGIEAPGSERFILRRDIDETLDEDLGSCSGHRIIGGDARFVEMDVQCEYPHDRPHIPANVSWCRGIPPSTAPLTMDRLQRGLLHGKRASLVVKKAGDEFKIDTGKRAVTYMTPGQTALKLASVGVPSDQACEMVDRAAAGETVRFDLLGPGGLAKLAMAWSGERWMREAEEFDGIMKEANRMETVKDIAVVLRGLAGMGAIGTGSYNAVDRSQDRFHDSSLSNGHSVLERLISRPSASLPIIAGALALSGKSGPALRPLALGGLAGAGLAGANNHMGWSYPTDPGAEDLPETPSLKSVGKPAVSPEELSSSDKFQKLIEAAKPYLTNPYVLGALATGGVGAAAYGAHKALSKDKKKDAPEKKAGAFYERDIDHESDFPINGYDPDLGIPVEYPDEQFQVTRARREQQVGPTPRYLDAHDPGPGHKAIDHIPDEIIMQMANPGQELAELGQRLGLETLIDHGAVSSLVKVFDAKPFITDYVAKMEGSIDYLGRTLFMLYWKPGDFSEMFGTDDLPHLENKLTGVFESYGDLVLELKQAVTEKPSY